MLKMSLPCSIELAEEVERLAGKVNGQPWAGFGPGCCRLTKGGARAGHRPGDPATLWVSFEIDVTGQHPCRRPGDEADFAAVFGDNPDLRHDPA